MILDPEIVESGDHDIAIETNKNDGIILMIAPELKIMTQITTRLMIMIVLIKNCMITSVVILMEIFQRYWWKYLKKY